MRWSHCIASIALFTPALALGQPVPPAHPAPKPAAQPAPGGAAAAHAPAAAPAAPVLTWKGEQLVLSSASAPDAPCKAVLIPGQANLYTFSPNTDCLEKLDVARLGIVARDITRKPNGTYFDGKTRLKVTAVFNPAGTKIDPQKISEQGPFLFVIDGKSFLQTPSLAATPQPTAGRRAASASGNCSFSEASDGDVVVDLAARSVRKNPARNVIGPNDGLTVYVCPDPSKPVNVTWGGTRGLTIAQVTADNHAGVAEEEGPEPLAAPLNNQPIRFTFPPRQAGTADLKLFDTDDLDGKPALTVELEVEPRYWGAVRFGLGTLFGRWKSYDVGTFAGSRQPQVRETSQGAAFELVSGFAPYVLDLGTGGRSQTGGPNMHLAPFVGFGVLGVAPDKGVQGLSSFHLGLEYEVATNLSIAATFVYHRSRQLAMGYTPGAPVAVGMTVDNVTTDSWERGFAIVINASPSFLQFATGDSSSKTGANR